MPKKKPAKKATRKTTTGNTAKAGRPKGSTTKKYKVVDSQPSRCPNPECQSTDREPYRDGPHIEMAYCGSQDGKLYTHVVWRRTRCRACGQHRIDRTHENRSE